MRSTVSTVSTRLSLGVEIERYDAGRDGRTCLARYTKLSGADGGREKIFFPAQLTTINGMIPNHIRLIHTLL